MGKVFVEYKSKNGRIPYSVSTICFCLTQYTRDYIRKERKNISDIDENVRDAVLVDAINYLGIKGGIDFALYTKDLYDLKVEEEEVDSQSLLTVITNYYAQYIFNENMIESVLRNSHMNRCTDKFDINDGIRVLIDFINYISYRNEYDKRFTVNELYEKYKTQSHNFEMRKLKGFLELTSKYSARLMGKEGVYDIFMDIADIHNLECVDLNGEYYSRNGDNIGGEFIHRKMYDFEKIQLDKDLYALAYAYYKMEKMNEGPTILVKKMIEMKK